jgi:phosphoglycerol transferase
LARATVDLASDHPAREASPRRATDHRRVDGVSPSTARWRAGALRLVEAFGIGIGALLIAAWIYRLWDRTLSLPLENVYDARQTAAAVKTIIEHGLYASNSELGAPFGKARFDWPVAGESLQRASVLGLSWFSDRFGVVMNAYYLLGFAVVAAVTHLVMRALRFGVWISGAVALVYAFLPYHFFHGESHLFRSAYFSAPIAGYVLLTVLSYRGTLLVDALAPMRSRAQLRANVRWRRVGGLVALTVVVGVSETMTTFFTVFLVAIAAIILAARDRSPGVLVPAAAVVGTLGLVYGVALAPNLVYWQQNGRNESAVRRIAAEQELYGLKPSQLALPIPEHRLHSLRSLQEESAFRSPVESEGGQGLGMIGAVGLAAALFGIVARGLAYRSPAPVHDRDALWRHAGLLALLSILLGTVSGFAMLASLAGFTQLRTWNRIVVLIGFFALVVVAVGFERVVGWLRHRARLGGIVSRAVPAVLAIGIVGFGLWDTAVPVRLDQEEQRPTTESMRGFVAELEARLPAGAEIFQLPVIPYPEYRKTYGRVFDYEGLLPYLWSRDLAWSYGVHRGRPEADWQRNVDSQRPAAALVGLRGLGFDGIVLDSFQYDDGGVAAARELEGALGPPDVTAGEENRWRFWDLRGYAVEAELDDVQLRDEARSLAGALVEGLPTPGP